MKHIYRINRRIISVVMLSIVCLASAPAMAAEPAWWTQQKRDCNLPSNLAYNNWKGECYSSHGSTASTPGYDYEAARRAQEAEAERLRQAEADRIKREKLADEMREKEKADFFSSSRRGCRHAQGFVRRGAEPAQATLGFGQFRPQGGRI